MTRISTRLKPDETRIPPPPEPEDEFENLITRLTELRANLLDSWADVEDRFRNFEPAKKVSAQNLVHYVALRRYDIRKLQNDLARHGISSLGRAESHVMTNINKVLKLLHKIVRRDYQSPPESKKDLNFDQANSILKHHTDVLLGTQPENRKVRIMVTLPSDAAVDYKLVHDLISAGMNCARINCAHDEPEDWLRMINNIRRAEKQVGRECKICIDIAGPKLRTGRLEDGPRVVRWSPARDVCGRVVKPARIWLTADETAEPPFLPATKLTLPKDFLSGLRVGDRIKFKDLRAARRTLKVTEIVEDGVGVWAECRKTAYVGAETKFKLRHKPNDKQKIAAHARNIPPLEQFIPLKKGDSLILTRAQSPGKLARLGERDEVVEPARLPCSLPEVFDCVEAGEKIWFDDGRLGGVIRAVSRDEIRVEITQAGSRTQKLRADKGINLPDSDLRFPSLTDKDLSDLKFIAAHADLVGYSFVRSARDVSELQKKLRKLGDRQPGIVLKIETRSGFERLPEILLTAMRSHSVGVMIARGDLAIETGFERLAEVQEEILWICEAAHIPVIWATQVLERLSRDGVYSRADITDAAMSERAECVMLNKGSFVVEAVRTLDNILARMEAHQDKKRPMLRRLHLADRFFDLVNNEKH